MSKCCEKNSKSCEQKTFGKIISKCCEKNSKSCEINF